MEPRTFDEIAQILLEMIGEKFGDSEVFSALQPLLQAAARLGVAEGLDAAKRAIDQIAAGSPADQYKGWDAVIAAATPEQRAEMLDESAKAILSRAAAKAKRKAELWKLLETALSVLVTLAGLLLV